jgi:acetyl/propionyl-CoA carboxylase alpha subunit
VRFEIVVRNGRRVRLAVARTSQGVWIGWPGGAKYFGPERREAAATGAAQSEVRAPMTGRVVAVPVRPGQVVPADDVLVILQAMKMEYRLTAPDGGVVERIHCAPGEMVDLGALLVTMAPVPEAATVSATPAAMPARSRPRRRARQR